MNTLIHALTEEWDKLPQQLLDNVVQTASPLVRLVEGDERWVTPDPPPGYSPSKLWWNRAKSYCYLYGAQGYGQRHAYIYPLTMMNFVGLDLTTPDSSSDKKLCRTLLNRREYVTRRAAKIPG
ncbi:hypothetical protein TNCV_3637351 [Trichonephila clavipes]|nr:hypothetical protein TNCV_3637351 [Trichonephila clavipes]